MTDALPQGWVGCRTGDISRVIGGGTPDAGDLTNFSTESGIPWLTPADLSGYKEIYISRGKRFLTKEGFEQSSAKLMPKGTVLFSSRAPIGYVAVAANEICTNQGFRSFVCADDVYPKYLYFWLKYAKPMAEELASGTTFAEISGTNAAKIPILLAPVAEQKRIAAKLEKLLDQVDTCSQRLAKIPALLKRFRQSVLAAACSGRLTADWRDENPNLETGATLLARIKETRLKTAESTKEKNQIAEAFQDDRLALGDDELGFDSVPDSWLACRIGAIGMVVNGSTPSRKQEKFWGGDVPWVSSGEVRNNIISATREGITKAGYESCSVRLLPRDTVLLAMIGEGRTRGQTSILQIEATVNQNIAAILIHHGLVRSEFLWRWFQLQYEATRERGSGSGPQALNCQRVRELPFVLPPLAEQQEIVRRVERLFALADQIEVRFAEGRNRVNSITQSILAKAFRGELVPTEYELAQAEGRSFESAEELLEKIKSNDSPKSEGRRPAGRGNKRRVAVP